MHPDHGIITGVSHPESLELYHIIGNKRTRLRRVIGWEKEYGKTYPRLKFVTTKRLDTLKDYGWIKAEIRDRLIPYNCMFKR